MNTSRSSHTSATHNAADKAVEGELSEHPGQVRIASLGGGHGLFNTLRGARVVADDVTAIVTVADEPVAMPLKEFDLLEYLLRNGGRVLTRGQLIDRIWGADYVGDTKTLDVHIKRLRTKIEAAPSRPTQLVTVRGLGYKFEA